MVASSGHTRPLAVSLLIWFATLCVPASAQAKRALLVGISDYPQTAGNAWAAIHGANDAELIAPVLKKQGFSTDKICNQAATATRIRQELDRLVASCKAGDVIYIHFSCHGQPFEDMDGDEEDGWDEAIVPYDAMLAYEQGQYEGANHITDDELNGYLQKLRQAAGTQGFVCVVVDACHAGGISRGDEDTEDNAEEPFVRGTKRGFSPHGKEFRPRINTNGHFPITQQAGLADIVILEACRSYQSNYEIRQAGKYFGPLSYYLSQVLAEQPLSRTLDWVFEVKKLMGADNRLIRQNMVYETSLK